MSLIHRIVLPCVMGGALGITMLGCSGKSKAPPSISSFSPMQGPIGSYVYILGSGFSNATGVTIGGVACPSFQIPSDSEVNANVPGNASSGVIVVSTGAGSSTTNASFFIVPGITSLLDATNGSALTMNPGDVVTITGSGFIGATAPLIFYGPSGSSAVSTPQPTYTVVNANQITTTVPASITPGAGYIIQVTVPGPSSNTPPTNTCSSPSFTIQ
jgi:hypothetical protein